MNYRRILSIVVVMLMLASVSLAGAANVHFKGGKNAGPAFFDGGLWLNASGALAGLGNEDILITLDARADVTAVCRNHGGNEAPGQNPAPINVTGSQAIPQEEIKNGNVSFSVTTEEPPRFIPGAPDCPNPNWEEEITDLAFTSAQLTVEQPEGTTVLSVSCTFSPPTSDGNVGKNNVTCG